MYGTRAYLDGEVRDSYVTFNPVIHRFAESDLERSLKPSKIRTNGLEESLNRQQNGLHPIATYFIPDSTYVHPR